MGAGAKNDAILENKLLEDSFNPTDNKKPSSHDIKKSKILK